MLAAVAEASDRYMVDFQLTETIQRVAANGDVEIDDTMHQNVSIIRDGERVAHRRKFYPASRPDYSGVQNHWNSRDAYSMLSVADLTADGEFDSATAYVHRPPRENPTSELHLEWPDTGGFLVGYARGNNGLSVGDLVESAAAAESRPGREIAGLPTTRTDASTPHGVVSLWMAEGVEVPLRFVMEKNTDHLFDGSPMREHEYPRESVRYVYEVTELVDGDSGALPLTAHASAEIEYSDGSHSRSEFAYEVERMSLNPDVDEEQFRIQKDDIPEGARVIDYRAPRIRLVKRNGEIVPLVEDDALEAIDGTTDEAPKSEDASKGAQDRKGEVATVGDSPERDEDGGDRIGITAVVGMLALAAIGVAFAFVVRTRRRPRD